jgi:hypothetical protein
VSNLPRINGPTRQKNEELPKSRRPEKVPSHCSPPVKFVAIPLQRTKYALYRSLPPRSPFRRLRNLLPHHLLGLEGVDSRVITSIAGCFIGRIEQACDGTVPLKPIGCLFVCVVPSGLNLMISSGIEEDLPCAIGNCAARADFSSGEICRLSPGVCRSLLCKKCPLEARSNRPRCETGHWLAHRPC